MKSLQNLSEKIFTLACATAGIDAPKNAEISILLVDVEEMRLLNHEWRGRDYATNVLSFPTGDMELIGDIVLCDSVIKDEARDMGKTYDAHLTHMLLHGALHLLGFDHETRADAERMEAIEIKALKKIGIGNPYE